MKARVEPARLLRQIADIQRHRINCFGAQPERKSLDSAPEITSLRGAVHILTTTRQVRSAVSRHALAAWHTTLP